MNDLTVAFVSAALELSDPFVDQKTSGIQLYVKYLILAILFLVNFILFSHMDEQYSCLIRDYSLPPMPPKPPHSAVWLKRLLPRPFLPIHLNLRYPWNLVSNSQHLHVSYQLNLLLKNRLCTFHYLLSSQRLFL